MPPTGPATEATVRASDAGAVPTAAALPTSRVTRSPGGEVPGQARPDGQDVAQTAVPQPGGGAGGGGAGEQVVRGVQHRGQEDEGGAQPDPPGCLAAAGEQQVQGVPEDRGQQQGGGGARRGGQGEGGGTGCGAADRVGHEPVACRAGHGRRIPSLAFRTVGRAGPPAREGPPGAVSRWCHGRRGRPGHGWVTDRSARWHR
ncbi:hypothetical protein GCM10020000_57330 [Streptomyces olivoverticillatus]